MSLFICNSFGAFNGILINLLVNQFILAVSVFHKKMIELIHILDDMNDFMFYSVTLSRYEQNIRLIHFLLTSFQTSLDL